MIKKIILVILILLPLIAAQPNLEVEEKSVTDTFIPGLEKPAIYQLEIKNNGETDTFEIYDLAGYGVTSNGNFSIGSGETETVNIEIWPEDAVLENPGTHRFIYKIKGAETGIKEFPITLKVLNLEDSLEINSYNIGLDSDSAKVYIKNKGGVDFDKINSRFHSSFFDFNKEFSLKGYEKKEFSIELDKSKINNLTAGTYTITSEISVGKLERTIQNNFKYTEKANIETRESSEGIFITKKIVEKTNQGNLPVLVQAKIEKNIISRLFTFFNSDPSSVKRQGFNVEYVFQKEIDPGESYTLKATTNWLYPLILLASIIIIVYLIKTYSARDLILKKKATYAKTKSGKFALKVRLIVKAKDYVENISVLDKIPSMVKVHKKFGANKPDKIDEKNRRLEWSLNSLQKGEERIFSYIIYSDISPVGKFELPTATSTYERDGKIREVDSNKIFFLTKKR
jgi:hypothetical protein